MLVERDFQVFLVQAFTEGAPELAMNWSLEKRYHYLTDKIGAIWGGRLFILIPRQWKKKSVLKQQWTTVQTVLFTAELWFNFILRRYPMVQALDQNL